MTLQGINFTTTRLSYARLAAARRLIPMTTNLLWFTATRFSVFTHSLNVVSDKNSPQNNCEVDKMTCCSKPHRMNKELSLNENLSCRLWTSTRLRVLASRTRLWKHYQSLVKAVARATALIKQTKWEMKVFCLEQQSEIKSPSAWSHRMMLGENPRENWSAIYFYQDKHVKQGFHIK